MPRFVALAGLICAFAIAAPAASATSQSRLSMAVLEQVNAARAQNGVGPLRPARSLQRSARRYARRMVRGNFFAHQSPLPISHRFRRRGEVLEWTTRRGAATLVRVWLRSPVHAGLLLSPTFREAGFGRARGTIQAGGGRGSVWVGHLGRR